MSHNFNDLAQYIFYWLEHKYMGTSRMKYRKGQNFRTYLFVGHRLVILLIFLIFLFELCMILYLKFVEEWKVGLTQFVKNGDD